MPKRTPEPKLAEIRRLWRSLPIAERRKFLKSTVPRLDDQTLVEMLAIVTQQIEKRDLGSYGCRVTLMILSEVLISDVAIEQVLLHLNNCLALPTAKIED